MTVAQRTWNCRHLISYLFSRRDHETSDYCCIILERGEAIKCRYTNLTQKFWEKNKLKKWFNAASIDNFPFERKNMLLILSYAPCSTSCSNKLRSTSSRCGSSRSYLFVVTTKIQMTRPSNRFVTHYFRRTISWSVSCKDANENRGTKSSAAQYLHTGLSCEKKSTLFWNIKAKSVWLFTPLEFIFKKK